MADIQNIHDLAEILMNLFTESMSKVPVDIADIAKNTAATSIDAFQATPNIAIG